LRNAKVPVYRASGKLTIAGKHVCGFIFPTATDFGITSPSITSKQSTAMDSNSTSTALGAYIRAGLGLISSIGTISSARSLPSRDGISASYLNSSSTLHTNASLALHAYGDVSVRSTRQTAYATTGSGLPVNGWSSFDKSNKLPTSTSSSSNLSSPLRPGVEAAPGSIVHTTRPLPALTTTHTTHNATSRVDTPVTEARDLSAYAACDSTWSEWSSRHASYMYPDVSVFNLTGTTTWTLSTG
jgi:hypothetical protein